MGPVCASPAPDTVVVDVAGPRDVLNEHVARRDPTATLLWEACRPEPDPTAVRRAFETADTALAVVAAGDHRIGPLLWRALGAAQCRDGLGPAGATLGATADAGAMEARLLLPRAVALAVRPLTDAGLEPVVFKGPAVAERYPHPGLRPMDDIDLLLPQAAHARALEALCASGWRVARPSVGHYDTVLAHADVPTLLLELHFGLETGWDRVTALDPVGLWERRVPTVCAGTPAFGLPMADELVALAAHAGKPFHGFSRLIWIADLAMVVHDAAERGEPVDWDRVCACARAGRCTTVVSAALALARRAGVEVPPGMFELPTRGWRGESLRRLLAVDWPLAHPELHRYALTYALTDSPALRLKMLLVTLSSWHGLSVQARLKLHRLRPGLRARRPAGLVSPGGA